MAVNAPWSVKGIDPKAREIAKGLARRSGMTLGEWLNQMILEDSAAADEAPARAAAPAAYGRGIDQSVTRSLGDAEREQTAVVADIADAQNRISERIRRIEEDGPGPSVVEAVRAMETSLAKVASRLYDGEARAEQRFAALRGELDEVRARLVSSAPEAGDARAEMAENLRQADDDRFERIERSLAGMTAQVDRAERRSAHAIERMGHEVLRMAGAFGRRVQDVENRSADAIEQVGGQVARMAGVMEARLERSDQINAHALEKLGAEIARITEQLAERIANAERRSAQAMDEMGEQVARVSDRLQDRAEHASTELAERIRLSEERTARLLEDARGRIDQRLEQGRLRQAEAAASEGPDAALFDDPDVAPVGGDDDQTPRYQLPQEDASFASDSFEEQEQREALIASDLAEIDVETLVRTESKTHEPVASGGEPVVTETRPFADFDDDDLAAATAFDDETDDEETRAFLAEAVFVEAESPPPDDNTSLPEADIDEGPMPNHDAVLEEDLLAAEAMAHGGQAEGQDEEELDAVEPATPRPPLTTRELIEQTRAAARAAPTPADLKRQRADGRRGFGARRGPSAMTTALFVSGGAAALSMALVGYEFVLQKPAGQLPTRVAAMLGLSAPAAPLTSERPVPGEGGQPLAAIALSPTPTSPIAAQTPNVRQSEAAAEFYADGVRRIEAHDNSGLDPLKRAANLGYGPAEFYLAKLYEGGQAGLKKDLVQARTWTDRAAEAGDVRAMHNLALDYFEGAGGPKDVSQAADWFHRAADQGLVDSQYNLARLYEQGLGVTRNPAEAYKWYLIAARSGDAESATAAQRLKSTLSPEAQAAAERSAQGFAPDSASPASAEATGSSSATAEAQRSLSRLGYYQGPYDGVGSPALSLAIAAFQRDQGLPDTGALDPTVNQRLAAVAQ